VLLPSWVSNSISGRIDADSDLYTFLSLLVMAGLVDAFAGSGEPALVAPMNSAFAKLIEANFDLLTSAVGRELLSQTLLYYVLHGVFECIRLMSALLRAVLSLYLLVHLVSSSTMPRHLALVLSPTTVSSTRLTVS
jgi:uncharacterized surface protein with fasciclin (FAS1) repeats